jgi:hypothetical protein
MLGEKYKNSNPETDKVISEDRRRKQEKNIIIQNGGEWHCWLYASEVVTIYV